MTEQEFENYWNTLLGMSGDVKVFDDERLKLLSMIKCPDFLYRFRSVSESSLEALQNNVMYFSSANYYDDPFDSYLRADISKLRATIEGIKDTSQLIDVLNQEYPNLSLFDINPQNVKLPVFDGDIHLFREQIQKTLYSICFCEDYTNEVLWLKYAENHKGFILEYVINDEVKNMLWKDFFCNVLPIYYSDEKYDAYKYAVYSLALSLLDNSLKTQDASDMYVRLLFQPINWEITKISVIKRKCHQYDKEWRIVPSFTMQNRKRIFMKPKSITVGLRTPEYKKRLIISAAQAAGISEFYQMVINEHDEFVRLPLKI